MDLNSDLLYQPLGDVSSVGSVSRTKGVAQPYDPLLPIASLSLSPQSRAPLAIQHYPHCSGAMMWFLEARRSDKHEACQGVGGLHDCIADAQDDTIRLQEESSGRCWKTYMTRSNR